MEIIFDILCGCLYLIGKIFGLSYKDISVYICIYGCPIICIFSVGLSLCFGNIRTWLGRILLSANIILLHLYICIANGFWEHFEAYPDPFQQCVDDLMLISRNLNITYAECNIYVYCVLFPLIVLLHLSQVFLFWKKSDIVMMWRWIRKRIQK